MIKFALGITVGYIFSDLIDELLNRTRPTEASEDTTEQ